MSSSSSSLQTPNKENTKLPPGHLSKLRSRSPEHMSTTIEHFKETFFAEDIVKLEPNDDQIECEGSTQSSKLTPGEPVDKGTIIYRKSDTSLHSSGGLQNKHTTSPTVVASPLRTGMHSNDVHLGHAIPVTPDSNHVIDESSFYEELATSSQDFVYRTRNKRRLLVCQKGSLLEHPKQQKMFSRSSTCSAGSQETDPKNKSAEVIKGEGPCVVSSGAKSLRKRSADCADASHLVKTGKVVKKGTIKQEPQPTIQSEEDILQAQCVDGDKGIVQNSNSSEGNDGCNVDCDDDGGDDCQLFFSALSNRQHPDEHLKSTPQSWAMQYALGILGKDEVDAILGLAEYDMSESTVRRTRHHVTCFYEFLHSQGENRHIETIPPRDLDPLLGTFFTEFRKADGEECEPRYLKNLQCSLEGYLRFKGYGWSISQRGFVFQGFQEKLQRKVDQLDEQGKCGFVFDDITMHDIDTFYKCGELGGKTPNSLLNTVWFINCWHFGLKTFKEHARMVWGDLQLQKDRKGCEVLVFTPANGQTAVTVPSDPQNPSRCPVTVYKRYRRARPPKTLGPEAPFYLGISSRRNCKQTGSDTARLTWFHAKVCGNGRLKTMVRRMAIQCGIGDRRLCNGSLFKLISSIENGTYRDEPHLKHIPQPTEIVWQAC